jgi:ribosomal protein S8
MPILDPKKYMEAVKSANELRDIQRVNQARSDFQEFTPDLTSDFTGLKLGAQPDTRQMIRKNADGSYGTPTGLAESNTRIDPNAAPKAGAGAMQTNYNYYTNQVDERFKNARPTGLAPNINNASLGRAIDNSLGSEGKDYLLNKYGEPISGIGAFGRFLGFSTGQNEVDEYQTKKAIAEKLADEGFVEGIDDVDRYIEFGLPNMKPGATADVMQSRIRKRQQEEFAATLDFTKDEREELDRVSKITDNDERDKAKKTVANKIDVRRQRDTLNKIKAMPEGPVKKAELEKLRNELRMSVTDEMINVRQSDGSYMQMPKLVAEIQGIKNTTDPSKITKTFENVTLSGAGSAVQAAIQKRNDIVRLANIAKSEGNRAKFEGYRAQLSALDSGIVLAQGMQGLNDIDRGDTRRLSATLSNSLGVNVQIIPRDDNKFDVRQGNQTTVMDAATIKRDFQPVFDQEYKKKLKEIAISDRNKIFETELKIKEQLSKSISDYNQAIAVETLKGINELRKAGFTITKTENGTIVQKDGAIGIIDTKIVENQAGEEVEMPYVRDINVGELGSGLGIGGLNVSDYENSLQ